jgi:membrane protein DedA with SNARE-associated domain
VALGLALAAAMIADTAWYLLGRTKGGSILRLLCRISLEPDSCVSSTQSWFRRLGGWALVVAKFFPGLGTVAAPMAGFSRMPVWQFLIADAAGGLLWGGTWISLGYVFRAQLEDVGVVALRLGGWLLVVMVGLAALWVGFKYWQRRRFMKSLRVARITPEEVLERIDDVVILDLRTSTEVERDGMKLARARWFDRKELEERHQEIPRDRDVVLYCT